MNLPGEMRGSAIVAAHPDDEILWFSSILKTVDQTVICFCDVPSRPDWSAGRRRSLAAYPLDNMECLHLAESEVFNGAEWANPVPTAYGLEVHRTKGSSHEFSESRYRENFARLKEMLRPRLKDHRNVFTHNPWGEYGHEEHVQVFQAVAALAGELNFTLWFSNYCSNKSHALMLRQLEKVGSNRHTLAVNEAISAELKSLYTRENCWTWYDHYQWPPRETFFAMRKTCELDKRFGEVLPLNMISVEWPPAAQDKGPWYRSRRGLLRRLRQAMTRD